MDLMVVGLIGLIASLFTGRLAFAEEGGGGEGDGDDDLKLEAKPFDEFFGQIYNDNMAPAERTEEELSGMSDEQKAIMELQDGQARSDAEREMRAAGDGVKARIPGATEAQVQGFINAIYSRDAVLAMRVAEQMVKTAIEKEDDESSGKKLQLESGSSEEAGADSEKGVSFSPVQRAKDTLAYVKGLKKK